MLKDTLGRVVQANAFASDKVYAALTKRETAQFRSLVHEMSQLDTIADIGELVRFRRNVQAGARWFTRCENVTNCNCYGIWKSVFPFLDEEEALWAPSVEHGFIALDCVTNETFKAARLGCVTFSDFRREIIQKHLDIPVFSVGPYIQYADQYYDEQRISELRRENGKTLLFFVGHSVNTTTVSRDEERLFEALEQKRHDFDTIMVCIFWWDCDSAFVKKCEALGYRVVSAGYLNDPLFMRRQKTIIGLADAACSDAFGTYVLYCAAEGVPFEFIDAGLHVENSDAAINAAETFEERIRSLFAQDNGIEPAKCAELKRYYCGIGVKRSLQQRKDIAEATRDLTRASHGFRGSAHAAAKRLCDAYTQADAGKLAALAEGYAS